MRAITGGAVPGAAYRHASSDGETLFVDDVGQGYDIALGDKEKIVATLGRHPNDLVTSFYMHTPSDILVEYGWVASRWTMPPGSRRR